MSGDSEFNRDFDEYETRSYEQPVDPDLAKLQSRSKNGCIIGCIMMFSPIGVILLAAIVPSSLLGSYFLPLMIVSFVLIMAGIGVMAFYGVGSTSLLKAYEILDRLGTPKPQIRRGYVIKEYNDVYLIGKSMSSLLYFVAFRSQAGQASASKMKLPGSMWKWEKKVEVGNIKLFRREGVYAVPTERGDFVSGECVLYAEAFMPTKYNLIVPAFTKDELLAIIEQVSEDAMNPTY